MSYCEAMEAAGAEVLAFQEFGSYQGDWWALVKYEGESGWVHGYYGSCSGCDAFQGEFDYSDQDQCSDHKYEYPKPESCTECDKAKIVYQEKLAAFGKSYVFGGIMTQAEAEKESREYDWCGEDYTKTIEGEMTEFIKLKGKECVN